MSAQRSDIIVTKVKWKLELISQNEFSHQSIQNRKLICNRKPNNKCSITEEMNHITQRVHRQNRHKEFEAAP